MENEKMIIANRKYITPETAPELLSKTVDCFKRRSHYYPIKVIQMGKDGRYFVVDRNSVAIPVNENDQIPYDFVVEEEQI